MAKNLFQHFKDSSALLTSAQKKNGIKLGIAILINIYLELFSLVSVFPLFIVVFSDTDHEQNSIVQMVYDFMGFESMDNFIYLCIALILLFFIIKTIFSYMVIKWKANYTANIAIQLSDKMYEKVLSSEEYENSGEQIVNIINIPVAFTNKSIAAFFDFVAKIMLIIIVFLGLAIYNLEVLFYLTIVIIPIAIVYMKVQSRHLNDIQAKLKKYHPEILQSALESLNGKIEIIMSGNKHLFLNEYSKINKIYNQVLARFKVSVNSSAKFIELIALIGICILFLYSTISNYGREEIFFILTIYSISAYKLIPSVNGVNVAYTNLKTHQYTTEIISEHLGDIKKSAKNKNTKKEGLTFNENIRFDNVSFKYKDSSFQVSEVNFKINKNDKVAFIGESGSGKSTIMQLLLRTIIESEGGLYVDNIKISDDDTAKLRNLISYVPQSVFLFEGSLLENVCMKNPDLMAQRSQVEEVLNSLGLTEFMKSSGAGIDTIIEENGSNISSGQKQRIGIARALLQNREIMVFDEITSNLDKENQKSLISLLQNTNLKKTLIFATHQPEIMAMCNVLLELKSGKVYSKQQTFDR